MALLNWLPEPAKSDLERSDEELLWDDLDDGLSVVYRRRIVLLPVLRNAHYEYLERIEDEVVFIGPYAIGG